MKKLLLAVSAVAALATPIVIGMLHPAVSHAQSESASTVSPAFESVSFSPKGTPSPTDIVSTRVGFHQHNESAEFTNFSLKNLVQFAYRLNESQISGGPAWITIDLFDVRTKAKGPMSDEQYRLELQKLLAERFKLAVHSELKNLPVYELAVGDGGAKLIEVQDGINSHSMTQEPAGHLEATRIRVSQLAEFLNRETGRPVVDKTGLTGYYDFALNWKTENTRTLPLDNAPLFNALAEQLGLKLSPAIDPINSLVIDHAARLIYTVSPSQ